MSSVLLGSSTPEQLIENLGAIQASIAAPFQQTPGMLQCVPRQCPGQGIGGQEAVSSNSALTQYMGSRAVLRLFNKHVPPIPQ